MVPFLITFLGNNAIVAFTGFVPSACPVLKILSFLFPFWWIQYEAIAMFCYHPPSLQFHSDFGHVDVNLFHFPFVVVTIQFYVPPLILSYSECFPYRHY